jgi:hypothetical protein
LEYVFFFGVEVSQPVDFRGFGGVGPVGSRTTGRSAALGAGSVGAMGTFWSTYKRLLKMAIEVVDLPIKNGHL